MRIQQLNGCFFIFLVYPKISYILIQEFHSNHVLVGLPLLKVGKYFLVWHLFFGILG